MTDRIDTSQITWLRKFSFPSISRFAIGLSTAYNNRYAGRAYINVVLSIAANEQSLAVKSAI